MRNANLLTILKHPHSLKLEFQATSFSFQKSPQIKNLMETVLEYVNRLYDS